MHLYAFCKLFMLSVWKFIGNMETQMWPDLIQKSKDGGLDAIETYVFWNLYEPV